MAMHAKMLEHMEQHIKWPATKQELMTTCNMHKDDASFPADERQKMIKAIEALPNDPSRRYTMAEFRQKMAA
jgi:hypothetical protein